MDSGSLLKAIMGPVEVKILLSLGGWLSHRQSCHISYFYMLLLLLTGQKLQTVHSINIGDLRVSSDHLIIDVRS